MRFRALCAAALLLAIACQAEKKAAPARVLTVPSEEEAQKFVASYLDALYKPNVARVSQLYDWESVLERATDVEGMRTAAWRKGVAEGARQSQLRLAENLVKNIKDGGSVDALRVRMVNGERRAIMRVVLPDGSFNYHEMPLVRDASGFVRARDIYIYASGEYFSDMLRRMFMVGAKTDPTPFERLMGTKKKSTLVENSTRMQEMMAKVRDGDGKGAVAIYKSMPEEIRREKSIMLAYVMACSKIDDEAHGRALEELRAAFPNDGGMEMMFIDANIIRGRYDEALRIVDKVDGLVGGDPYLDVIRTNIHLKEGSLDKAEAAATRATEAAPDLETAWWARVNVNLAQKDHAETARLLTLIRDDLEIEIDDLTKYPDYAEFVKSREYREFME
jgi:hypothetical protein